ncbi:hypothetical protein AMTRI_Chr04g249800 [Amborella trichopoda]
MLRGEMTPMMIGSTPMHIMLTLLFLMMSDDLKLFESSREDLDYGHLICHMCYFFPFLENELMTESKNFGCWVIFSYFYCAWHLWSMEWSDMYR